MIGITEHKLERVSERAVVNCLQRGVGRNCDEARRLDDPVRCVQTSYASCRAFRFVYDLVPEMR